MAQKLFSVKKIKFHHERPHSILYIYKHYGAPDHSQTTSFTASVPSWMELQAKKLIDD